MVSGQGVVQLVHVSPHYVIPYSLHIYRLLTYETIVYIYIYIYMYYNSKKLIVWYFVWNGVHVFVFMLSYFFFFVVAHYQFGAVFPDVELWTKCVCIDLVEVTSGSLT